MFLIFAIQRYLPFSYIQKKPQSSSRPRPMAQPLPGQTTSKPAVSHNISTTSAAKSRPPPAPPRTVALPPPPPPPPKQPQVPLYKAKFAFEGQEGEMSLKKDEIVELVEKDDNGWWLVKKNNMEGWAPNNYLELVPAQAAAPTPPPPPPRSAPAPKIAPVSTTASASAKPVSVFPGMAAGNGTAAPWKMKAATSNSDNSPAHSHPSSSLASKPPPAITSKPKPPVVAAKPGAPKVGAKPPIPSAPRPTPTAPTGRGTVTKPATAPGQVDLAAAVRISIFF